MKFPSKQKRKTIQLTEALKAFARKKETTEDCRGKIYHVQDESRSVNLRYEAVTAAFQFSTSNFFFTLFGGAEIK